MLLLNHHFPPQLQMQKFNKEIKIHRNVKNQITHIFIKAMIQIYLHFVKTITNSNKENILKMVKSLEIKKSFFSYALEFFLCQLTNIFQLYSNFN